LEHYNRQYKELNDVPTPLFSNAIELLGRLLERNKLLAVATGKGRDGLKRVMHESQTTHFFHASRCASDAVSKPDPQMLFSLLDELAIPANEAVMIGDTSHDLKMAQLAGIDSIGVTHGVHDASVLSQYNPKAIVNSLIELENILVK
jgi:phosphoglycolate phosphatase